MPVVTSGKVLVTGATGYVAQWIIYQLLQQGYFVRGTVRSEAKGIPLKEMLAEHGDRFELVVVEEMTADGAFDDAVRGVDGVLHVASPLSFTADDPEEVIRPAVKGTISILESTLKFGDAVKRVVITSSCASIYPGSLPEYHEYSDKDWNDISIQEVEAKGREASQSAKYRASKIRAERAAWQFFEEHRERLKFDFVVLNPPAIFGPFLRLAARTLDEVTGSMKLWAYVVLQGFDPKWLLESGQWVDVRDVAQAHVLALQKEEVAGERIIVAADQYKFQEFVNIARRTYDKIPVGDTSFDSEDPKYTVRFDTSKATKFFGIKYRSKEETTRDILAQFEKNGLLT